MALKGCVSLPDEWAPAHLLQPCRDQNQTSPLLCFAACTVEFLLWNFWKEEVFLYIGEPPCRGQVPFPLFLSLPFEPVYCCQLPGVPFLWVSEPNALTQHVLAINVARFQAASSTLDLLPLQLPLYATDVDVFYFCVAAPPMEQSTCRWHHLVEILRYCTPTPEIFFFSLSSYRIILPRVLSAQRYQQQQPDDSG